MQTIELIEPALQTSAGNPQAPFELVEREVPPPPVRALAVTPADLLRIAVERGDADLDRMERLANMVREWKAEEAKLSYRRDFAAFRGENIIIPKTRHVDRGRAGSFNQAEYDVVCRMLSPALSKHGFSFRHDQKFTSRPWTTDGKVSDIPWVFVTCYLEHRDGYRESLELEGPPGDLTANTPVQNMQVTGSYLKRQSLLAITGTATGGEDDESKMRGHGAHQEGGGDDTADADEQTLQAGRDASMLGMAPLTSWWGKLDAKQRNRFGPEFTRMRKAAAMADQKSGRP